MRHISPDELNNLHQWLNKHVYYRQIRGAESLLPGITPTGKRLRGLTLAPNLYLARDKHFYEVTADGIAETVDADKVLENYSLTQLKELYRHAVANPVGV